MQRVGDLVGDLALSRFRGGEVDAQCFDHLLCGVWGLGCGVRSKGSRVQGSEFKI